MTKNNRGREVYRAIYRILPQGDYYEWLEFWGITQKELDVFMDAGEEAVNKMYKERDSDGNKNDRA
jgi:hypothetical protein